jgi:SAM-dependent methyltransferase
MPDVPDNAARHLVTGAQYVEQITARESDRRARAAFRDLVLSIAQPGATVFDFGCGTGMDARFYAERGLRVLAYDVDRQMCEFFRAQCRDLIEAGRVTLAGGAYPDFLACATGTDPPADLVTANFAPLNLIDNLQELFAKFHALTAPNGKVLASVLSPYFVGDLRYRWWWRNLLPLLRNGRYSVAGSQAPIFRRQLRDFAAQSAPYFLLQRVFRGLPARSSGEARGIALGGGVRGAWLRLSTCRFLFLLFERRSGSDLVQRASGPRSVSSMKRARWRA